MRKESVFTLKLETELCEAFKAEAEADHRPASQIVRELMRDFVNRRKKAREYDQYLARKAEAARQSLKAGLGRGNDDVEADFQERRDRMRRRFAETDR